MDSKEQECVACGSARLIPMQAEFWPNTGPTFDDGTTCEPSRPSMENGESISSLEDFPARTFRLLVRGSELLGNALAYGLNSLESFAHFDLSSFSWKTRQGSLTGGLTEFSGTWSQAGLMRNGQCYRRVLWVHHIHVPVCFLWPTPRASDRRQLRRIACQSESEARREIHWPETQSRVLRELNGVPDRVDRLRGLGNAVVPQVAEWIGRRIVEANP